jgi:competence protein ComEC
MNYFARAPLVKILLPFLVGIISAIFIAIPFAFLEITAILLFFVLLVFTFTKLSAKYSLRIYYGFLLNFLIICCGYQLTITKTEIFSQDHFSKKDNAQLFLAEVSEPLVEKAKSYKAELKIISAASKGKLIPVKGSAVVYFQKDSLVSKLQMHDRILLPTVFKDIDPPKNPGEFNYKRYLSFHQIYQQAYLKSGEWKKAEQSGETSIFLFANQLREKLLSIFEKYKIEGQEFAVASALMVGYKEKIDAEITRAYAGAGAMHVLAVSGLHVGIIYMVINYLLFFLNRNLQGIIIKALITIVILWLYALVTGLSPSVLRASTMFSIIIIGKALGRNSNIYNSLAVSAVALLMINPFLIMEVGFQLSYLAVIGIVYLQPKIYNLLNINNKLLDYVWGLTAVSFSAQLATFPLGLLYFHQFPNYFLLSNLVVIPGAVLIIHLGVLLFIISPFEFIASFVSKIFNAFLYGLNYAVKWIEKLPYSITEGVYVTVFETWVIYAMIAALVSFMVTARRRLVFIFLLAGIIFFSINSYRSWVNNSSDKLIVYNIPKHTAINIISGRDNVNIVTLSQEDDKDKIQFHMRNNWIQKGFKNGKILSLNDAQWESNFTMKNNFTAIQNFYVFSNKKILHIKGELPELIETSEKLEVDYIIISESPAITLSNILGSIVPKKIIFDSSNSYYRIKKLIEECEIFDIAYHVVAESGAYIMEIK